MAGEREGSPEGQRNAGPGKHREPHVAHRPARDLLRPAVRAGRDAARHRAGDRRRCPARRGRPVSERIARGHGARQRERTADSERAVGSGLRGAYSPQRTRWTRGIKLERFVPLRPLCPPWWRAFVIARYTHPEMWRIWSDQRRYETWLLVETAAAEAMAAAGIVPPEAARDIRDRGGVGIARIGENRQSTLADGIAFPTADGEKIWASPRGVSL